MKKEVIKRINIALATINKNGQIFWICNKLKYPRIPIKMKRAVAIPRIPKSLYALAVSIKLNKIGPRTENPKLNDKTELSGSKTQKLIFLPHINKTKIKTELNIPEIIKVIRAAVLFVVNTNLVNEDPIKIKPTKKLNQRVEAPKRIEVPLLLIFFKFVLKILEEVFISFVLFVFIIIKF